MEGCRFRLWKQRNDILLGIKDLSLQIAPFNNVTINYAHITYAGPDEMLGNYGPESAHANDGCTAAAKRLLSARTNRREAHLSCITCGSGRHRGSGFSCLRVLF